MKKFADVILPLPLYASFTYEVPEPILADVNIGSLVLVQFGKKKFYTGIVESLHFNEPQGFEYKEISGVISSSSAIRYPQLNLWRWISDYYLCSPGDVFNAAIPTGMKPESETWISLNPDYESDETTRISDKEALAIQHIEHEKRLKVSTLQKLMNQPDILKVINSLLKKGIIEISEHIAEKYRPKKEVMVSLNVEKGDNDKLHEFFNLVTRSRAQEKALISFLDLTRWMTPQGGTNEISRSELLEKSGVNPPIIKALADKGIFNVYKKVVNRFQDCSQPEESQLTQLSTRQSDALKEIYENFKSHDVCLLHGITGSGKTEVYTHLIQHILELGNQVLYLVPEISLTTQLTDRLRHVFGDRLVVYHSKFSDNERVDIWKQLLASNEPLIVLGARSAVFLPMARIGLVIVDEEHEASFKQYDPAPRYNARDTAIVLASMHGAKTLLGSATPSVETYYKAKTGKFGLVELFERYNGSTLPDVEIVDMKQERKKKTLNGILSLPLRKATSEALSKNQQAIMFQNRRGFAPVVVCKQCGWTPKCRNCDVSLVYHKNSSMLRCHYCGANSPVPVLCPACGENSIEVFGYGTERIAEELNKEFADYRISRMDLDTTRNKNAYQDIIEEFSNHQTDILVGTQMVSKGLDFENVNVVGVLNADTLLNFPDFRSNERAFNMLEQVAGRAGRHVEKGHVFIQTYRPDVEVLDYVKKHDYKAYYEAEIADRKKLLYPPFSRIINIYLKNKEADIVDALAVNYALALREIFGERVLGPEKPFVSRVAGWHIQSIMLKIEAGASMPKVKSILRTIYESMVRDRRMKSTQVYYDVDPV